MKDFLWLHNFSNDGPQRKTYKNTLNMYICHALAIVFMVIVAARATMIGVSADGSLETIAESGSLLTPLIIVLRSPRGGVGGRRLSAGIVQRFLKELEAYTPVVRGAQMGIDGETVTVGVDGETIGGPILGPQVIASVDQPLLTLFDQGPALLVNADQSGRTYLEHHADVLSVDDDVQVGAAVMPPERYTSALAGPTVATRRRLDAGYGMQLQPPYSLDRIDQRALPLDNLYTYGIEEANGTGVDIYTLDSGIRLSHIEFAGGRVNLVDSINVSPEQSADDINDCAGHGTHVSGTMVGASVGVARGATLIVVRVYGANCKAMGPLSFILAGMSMAISIMTKRNRPAVCDLSFATATRLALLDQGAALLSAHCFVVAATGNNGGDACVTSPQAEGIVRVTASTRRDVLAAYSDAGQCIDIVAPGDAILSASYQADTALALMSGTSMSAPLVAGIAATYLSVFPTATNVQVKFALVAWASVGVLDLSRTPTTPDRLVYKPPCGWAEKPGFTCAELLLDISNKTFVSPSYSGPADEPSPSFSPALTTPGVESTSLKVQWVSSSAAEGFHTGSAAIELIAIFSTASTLLLYYL